MWRLFTTDRHMRSQDRDIRGDKVVSRTADTTNAREGENEMNICNFCGWEIARVDWYHRYNNKLICDNCVMDTMSKREKESNK
jgi:hypothetical protein